MTILSLIQVGKERSWKATITQNLHAWLRGVFDARASNRAIRNIAPLNRKNAVVWCYGNASLRPRPKFEIVWVCETPPIIVYSDVAISPRFGGKRDVTYLIYVKIKPYHFLSCFGKDDVVSNFSLNKK